jgi:plasmid stabilization system protein ParE
MGYTVILSTLAIEDLEQSVAYAAQNDPAAAERLGHRLLDQAETLRYLPHRGGDVRQPELGGRKPSECRRGQSLATAQSAIIRHYWDDAHRMA